MGPNEEPYVGVPMATQCRDVEQTTATSGMPSEADEKDPVARCLGRSAPAALNDAKRLASASGMQLHLIQRLFTVQNPMATRSVALGGR